MNLTYRRPMLFTGSNNFPSECLSVCTADVRAIFEQNQHLLHRNYCPCFENFLFHPIIVSMLEKEQMIHL